MKTKMYAIRRDARLPIPHPCLVCDRAEDSRLHGREPLRGEPGVAWWQGRPLFDGHYFHAYDPGERRREERRVHSSA